MINKVTVVKNGKVQTIETYDFPKDWDAQRKQRWLLNHDYPERAAYMIAFNISESEMVRIEETC